MNIINARRLRDYPKLMLVTTWVILAINLIFHDGWIGAFGQVIGGDYIVFYKTGMIYRSNPALIYDFDTQKEIQQDILKPANITSNNPFQNPPFVAPFFAPLTYLPLPLSLAIWTILAILSVFLSAFLMYKILPPDLIKSGLSYPQLLIIIFSFFPFIGGVEAGQNHWLTLLLVSAILIFTLGEQWYLSGIMTGLLLYKPQFVIGFLILWLVWRQYKALLAFFLVSIVWVGVFIAVNGIGLLQEYLNLSKEFMYLPFITGWPKYLLVTFYGLLTSIFPVQYQPVLSSISQILLLISASGLIWLAYILRKRPLIERAPALVGAILLPLLATPYALIHDMVILIPAFVLWARYSPSRSLLYTAIITYLGAFFLPLLGALTKFAWISFITIFLVIGLIIWIYSNRVNLLMKKPT